MKKIIVALMTLAVMMFASLSFAGAANATNSGDGVESLAYVNGKWTLTLTENNPWEVKLITPSPQEIVCGQNYNKPCASKTYTFDSQAECVTVQVDWAGRHGFNSSDPQACRTTNPDPDTKDVTLCHSTSSETNPYNKITVNINGWFNGHSKDKNDIWEAFTYKNKDGDTINVPAQGDTNLLQFDDCKKPIVLEKVVPAVKSVDKCGVKNDSVTLVPGRGYTGGVSNTGLVYSVTATVDNGFAFDTTQMSDWLISDDGMNASKQITLTDEDCGLPETGGEAQYNTTLGLIALLGVGALVGGLLFTRRQRS